MIPDAGGYSTEEEAQENSLGAEERSQGIGAQDGHRGFRRNVNPQIRAGPRRPRELLRVLTPAASKC